MKKCKLDGWIDIEQISIPPVRNKGFLENIIIREPVQAVTWNPPDRIDVTEDEKTMGFPYYEKKTVCKEEFEEETVRNTCYYQLSIERLKTGEKIVVSPPKFVIGRGKKADYSILGNPTISRRHVLITMEKEEFYMEDLKSENHTFVNGKILTEKVKVEDGMIFVLSDEKFSVQIELVRGSR